MACHLCRLFLLVRAARRLWLWLAGVGECRPAYAAGLVGGVSEAEGVASLVFGQAVVALGSGVAVGVGRVLARSHESEGDETHQDDSDRPCHVVTPGWNEGTDAQCSRSGEQLCRHAAKIARPRAGYFARPGSWGEVVQDWRPVIGAVHVPSGKAHEVPDDVCKVAVQSWLLSRCRENCAPAYGVVCTVRLGGWSREGGSACRSARDRQQRIRGRRNEDTCSTNHPLRSSQVAPA